MQYRTNQLSRIKVKFQQQLSQIYNQNEAKSLINMLIEHYLGLNRTDIALNPDYRVSESEILYLHFALKRLLKEEPIQYILEQAPFFGLRFYVNSSVLIPRQETEQLVSLILKESTSDAKILDIGTGSGCIALSLKSKLPETKITAIDISNEAIVVAKKNAENLNLNVQFVQQDILESNSISDKFDIIVSNPPYVTESDKQQMKNNVLQWEPEKALFVSDTDPLIFYREISSFAKHHLSDNGLLFFEINEKYGKEIKTLIEVTGYTTVNLYQDLQGKDRFIKASITTK